MTLEQWRRAAQWPLTVAALLFLVVYGWTVVGDLDRGTPALVTDIVMWVIWSGFVIDYAASLRLARPRLRWFVRHLPDLAIVLLPMFRPLRLLRLLTLVRVLQRSTGLALRGRVTLYVIASAGLLVLVGALGALDAQQDAVGANITTFGDAVWWAFTTITTVG